MKPISPQEANENFQKNVPSFVIDAVNSLISSKFTPSKPSFILLHSEVKNKILSQMDLYNTHYNAMINWDDGFMDFEGSYIRHGWDVSYVKKSIGDTFESHYQFKPKK